MLQLEVGKYYRNRRGEKIGPLMEFDNIDYPFKYDTTTVDKNGFWSSEKDPNSYDLIEEWKDEETKQVFDVDLSGFKNESPKIKSDGGSTAYYNLPENAKELNDIIEAKNMSFARGEAFKGLYRLGEKDGTETLYDVNKIIYFALRMKARILRGEKP